MNRFAKIKIRGDQVLLLAENGGAVYELDSSRWPGTFITVLPKFRCYCYLGNATDPSSELFRVTKLRGYGKPRWYKLEYKLSSFSRPDCL